MHLKWNSPLSKALAASVAAASFMATANLHAIPRSPCDEKPIIECGCPEPEPPPGPFAFAFPFDHDLNCPFDVCFYADFLAMQAKQDGMEFAIADTGVVSSSSALTDGSLGGFSNDHRDWTYNFGARFGVAFYVDHDAWFIDADWTWLNIRDYKKFGSSTGGGHLIPIWETGDPTTPDSVYGPRSSAVWNCNLNILDIKLGKPYYISRYVVFNPHFGFRGGWIDQHFSVDYSGELIPGPTNNRTIHHGQNDFWGIGLRTGLESEWMIGQGFSIIANTAGSLLYGKFRIDQQLQIPDFTDGSFVVADRHYMNLPTAEVALGLAWGRRFMNDRYYVSVKAAYEFQVWFDQLSMRRFFSGDGESFTNDVVSRGNLTLNGFSLRFSFDI